MKDKHDKRFTKKLKHVTSAFKGPAQSSELENNRFEGEQVLEMVAVADQKLLFGDFLSS